MPPPPPFPTAADHNFIPKGLRPITITRYALPAQNLDPLYVPFPSMWTSSARPAPPPPPSDEELPPGMKVKLLCGCGGRILPRPSDGALRYVGGQTRIVSVRRDVGFREFMAKMAEVYGPAPAVKYQLPDEDLDALVSVSCAEDLANMMEEYDKLADSSPDGSAKLRVFNFSVAAGKFDPSAAQFDSVDSSQRYIEAVNGVVEVASPFSFRPASAAASAKDGTGSIASSANSEVNAEVDGTSSTQIERENPALLPQAVLPPQDGSRVLYNPMGMPLENAADYPMSYFDPYRVVYPSNPPPTALAGTIFRDSMNGYSMLAPTTVAMQSASSSPRAGLQSNGGPTSVQPTSYVLVSPQELPGTVNPRPPLPPQVVLQEQLVKLDECTMCQKQLPHAHSDSILQEPVNVIAKTISEPNQLFQSHVADEDGRFSNQLRSVVTGGMSGDVVNSLGYQGAVAATQPWLSPYAEPATTQEVIPQSFPLGLMPSNGVPVRTAPLDQVHGMIRSGSSNDLIRPVDAKLEALHVRPPEFVDHYRSTLLRPEIAVSKGVVPESLVVNGGARLVENCPPPLGSAGAFVVQPNVISDGIYARPVALRPPNVEVPANLHNYQPVEPNRISPSLGNPEISGNLRVDFVPIVPGFESTHLPGEMIQGRLVSDAPSFPVVSPPVAASPAFPGLAGQNLNPAASNTLFSNQDPWTLMQQAQQSHVPLPGPIKTVGNNPFAERDPVNEAFIMTNGVEASSKFAVEESQVNQPTERSNQGLVEEQIKQDLKAVAEGVAASVLQTSVNSSSLSSKHHSSQPDDQSNRSKDTLQDNGESQSQDLKSKKQLDKAISGLNITEDINRLQIIKSCDLEELRELGSGTFGTVYHGKWKGSDVAIKRINDRCFAGKSSEQERLRADFWNEACRLADLHHPNVVAFYGVVLDGPAESVATVTEYMVNGSLRHALQRNDRSLDRRKRLLIAMDVAFGMEYLHEKNIVHFDLKSDNLLVNLRDSHRPICKVGDLGLSKVKCQTLISGGVRGTLPWMAPELLNGSSSLVSEKVDVFSFGIVLWELLTGEEPYGDLHYGAIIGGIVNNTLRPPVPETCDPEWKSLMEQCWASEPRERPCFPEIASRLRAMAASLPPKEKPHTTKNEVKGQ